MATVTTPSPKPKWDLAESRSRVQHPLERLRGIIRAYVTIEGLAVLLLYLALWFWIGILLDYGCFKAFGVDWVQVLPLGLRFGLLIVLTAGLLAVVAVKVILRLVRDFRSAALALVLERRFPKLLGDRLITAVEMADPKIAKRYGFSQAMIDHTVREAAERVEQAPVGQVFNWNRLVRYGVAVLVLTLGLYLLVGAASLASAAWRGQPMSVGQYVHHSKDVGVIWFERNVLLWNTIWPRRVHLELVGFPETGELRLGRNAASAPLRVRALKWVVADHTAPEGWRAIDLDDLPRLGLAIPPIPAEWQKTRTEWTVDLLDQSYANDELRQELSEPDYTALEKLFAGLEELAADPRQSRNLRKLEIPENVSVRYWGAKRDNEMSLKKGNEHEYTGTLSDLTESVRFYAWAEDYATATAQITLVPPPSLVKLLIDEDFPAYLYHRKPLGGAPEDLKGKKQQRRDREVSVSGETTSFDLPAGTDLVLTGLVDKELALRGGVRMLPRAVKGKAAEADVAELLAKTPIEIAPDRRQFRVRFTNLTRRLDFDFELKDTDNVVGRRHMVIKPNEDTVPEVDVLVETIRKTAQGYMVTPVATIPFSGKVRDDHGLDQVDYVYTVAQLDSTAVVVEKVGWVVGGLQFSADNLLTAPLYLSIARSVLEAPGDEEKSQERVPLPTFVIEMQRRAAGDVPLSVFMKRLEQPPPARPPLLRDFTLDPKFESFDLQRVLPQLKVNDDRKTQPRYRLRLGVAAADNNVETGPGLGQAKERFIFIVVSETELLAEIAKEEENLHVKLEDTVNRLRDAKLKLDEVALALAGLTGEQLRPQALRAQEIEDAIIKGMDITREVYTDYSRILSELKVNRVQQAMIAKVEDKICKPLDGALNLEFIRAEEAERDFRKTLEARKPDTKTTKLAQDRLEQLIDRLIAVLESMGDLTTINKLIVVLRTLEDEQGKQSDRLREMRDRIEEILVGGILDKPPPKDKPSPKNP